MRFQKINGMEIGGNYERLMAIYDGRQRKNSVCS